MSSASTAIKAAAAKLTEAANAKLAAQQAAKESITTKTDVIQTKEARNGLSAKTYIIIGSLALITIGTILYFIKRKHGK
jgi:cobalamin biosynthesis Mg chelatase CobN